MKLMHEIFFCTWPHRLLIVHQLQCTTKTWKIDLKILLWSGNEKLVELLIQHGADVNIGLLYHNITPLHVAASKGILCSIDLNHMNFLVLKLFHGTYFLFCVEIEISSIIVGHAKIAEILIEKGANVNAKDGDERTPLFEATNNSNWIGIRNIFRFMED